MKNIIKHIHNIDDFILTDKKSYSKLVNTTPPENKLPVIKNFEYQRIEQEEIDDFSTINAEWFKPSYSEKYTKKILTPMNPGAFIVRKSHKSSRVLVLSLRADTKIHHYSIFKTNFGFKLEVRFEKNKLFYL